MARIPTVRYGTVSGADGPQGYGEIYTLNTTVGTTATTSFVQVLGFTANGFSDSAVTPDHTNDHLTVVTPGVYRVSFNVSFSGAANKTFELEVLTNNGTTALGNIHAERKLGSGGDIGSAGASGFLSLSSGDTVELWAKSTAGGGLAAVVRDANLNISMVAEA